MKLVLLAGGLGTRLSEETHLKPKPMVEIGGMPIIWHIMKYYSCFGVEEFIICAGYKSQVIKRFFRDYELETTSINFDLGTGQTSSLEDVTDNWKVSVIDTGRESMTGGRLKRIEHLISEDETFFMTYGDGLSNVNIHELEKTHKQSNALATLTSVSPSHRFGKLEINDKGFVKKFTEKPPSEELVNGGFFVLSAEVFKYIDGDESVWEQSPLMKLAKEGKLMSYHHKGFWQPMDTLRDKKTLEDCWYSNMAPWKIW